MKTSYQPRMWRWGVGTVPVGRVETIEPGMVVTFATNGSTIEIGCRGNFHWA